MYATILRISVWSSLTVASPLPMPTPTNSLKASSRGNIDRHLSSFFLSSNVFAHRTIADAIERCLGFASAHIRSAGMTMAWSLNGSHPCSSNQCTTGKLQCGESNAVDSASRPSTSAHGGYMRPDRVIMSQSSRQS